MLRLSTLSFGLLLSTSSFASNADITCQRMMNSDADQELCFESVDLEATLVDIQVQPEINQTDSRNFSYRMNARVLVANNPCSAENMQAKVVLSVDEYGQSSIMARIQGWKEINQVCDRDYQPVYQDVTILLHQDGLNPIDLTIKNAELVGLDQNLLSN